MIQESLEVDKALSRGIEKPYAFLRFMSEVKLGPTPQQVDTEELLEARFFSEEEEIRLFRRDGRLEAALFYTEPFDWPITETYEIANPKFGRELTVCHHLDADEDGQTYVAATCLSGWKGGKQDE